MKDWRFLFFLVLGAIGISCSRQIIRKGSGSYCYIPVQFHTFCSAPVIQVDIEGGSYLVKVDLGSQSDFSFQSRVYGKIHAEKLDGVSISYDIHGNTYERAEYQIPRVQIENLKIEKSIATEESDFFITTGCQIYQDLNGVSWSARQQLNKIDGRMGNAVFRSVAPLFYFSQNVIVVASCVNELLADHFLDGYIQLPFEIYKGLIVLNVETGLGVKRLFLDTGASVSFLKQKESEARKISSRLAIQNSDFGKWKFLSIPFPEQLEEVDGALGIDFFKKHAVCLDFQTQTAYIQPPRMTIFR